MIKFLSGGVTYLTRFKGEWSREWPFITKGSQPTTTTGVVSAMWNEVEKTFFQTQRLPMHTYGSGKTNTTCILNGALKPYYQDELVQQMKDRPYSISIDGSNDTGRDKMNPLTVKLFDVNMVKHKFLDMCITSEKGAGTAEEIFRKWIYS